MGRIITTGELGVSAELWQGSDPTPEVNHLPHPLVIVRMNHDSQNWCADNPHPEHSRLLVNCGITDDEQGTLPAEKLLALVEEIVGWLKEGHHVLIHCLAGVSRSGYATTAVVMRLTGWSADRSLAWIRQRYERTCPNEHFLRHLRALEPRLTA